MKTMPTRAALLFIAALTLGPGAAFATAGDPWIDPSYQTRVILSGISNVGGQGLTDFPILVQLSNQSFLSTARADGADISFAGVDGKQLFHEIESLDTTNGNLTAWVCVPTFTNNTQIYLYFANPGSSFPFSGSNTTLSITTNLTNARDAFIRSNAWNAQYDEVYHFAEGSGLFQDSTRYTNHAIAVDVNIRYQSNGISGPGIYADGNWGKAGVNLPSCFGFQNITNTFSFWFAPVVTNQYTNNTTLFDQSPNAGHYFRANGTGIGRMAFNRGLNSPSFPYNPGTWQWFASTHCMSDTNAGNFTATFFTNGQPNSTDILSAGSANSTSGRNSKSYFMGTPNTSGNYSGGAWGLADELRVSRIIRPTNWLLCEYSNAIWARRGYAISSPEYASRPTALSPLSGTVTNQTVTFSWFPGNYGAPLAKYLVTVNLNGTNGLLFDAGTNLSITTNLGALLGSISTNAVTWWVSAVTTAPATHDSTTNAWTAAYTQRARIQGRVQLTGGTNLAGALVQFTAQTNGWYFTDGNGTFDLGALTILQPLTLVVTPSGSTGGLPFTTNLTIPSVDSTLVITVSNAWAPAPTAPLLSRDQAAVFIAGQRDLMRLQLPLTWEQQGLTTVTLIPLRGGNRMTLWSGLAGIANSNLDIPMTPYMNQITPGVYILETRQASLMGDTGSERVDRRMMMIAR